MVGGVGGRVVVFGVGRGRGGVPDRPAPPPRPLHRLLRITGRWGGAGEVMGGAAGVVPEP